ncbi:AraC family transcriptional regulator [Haloechinothrix salitolerans]|uniref:AraC family transcriptional regulator n=1 Tax=Haloechinothrix salitolerans TaxID=926830 RepID=A0ABW2BVQ7_9PSEU
MAQVFCDHRIDLVGRASRLDTHMNCQRIRNTSLASITYGGDVKVDPGECENFFPVMAILEGRGTFRCGNDSIDATPDVIAVASPTLPLSMRLAAGTKLVIARIERPALEATLRELLDQSLPWPIEFQLGMNATEGMTAAWASGFLRFINELDSNNRSWSRSHSARGLERWLMEGLLLAQPNNYTHVLDGDTRPIPNRVVDAAIELMEAHPESEHTISSLASAAGVSARALQEAFRRHTDVTPMRYLREVRLERAHQELLAAEPDTTTVGKVAARWGSQHLSRFASAYHARYGEYPSTTLRK